MAMAKVEYGYYDDAQQHEPAYDPGIERVLCPICSKPLTRDDIRSISMMDANERHASYFYRVHKSCHEALIPLEQDCIDCVIWDLIEADGKKTPGGDN